MLTFSFPQDLRTYSWRYLFLYWQLLFFKSWPIGRRLFGGCIRLGFCTQAPFIKGIFIQQFLLEMAVFNLGPTYLQFTIDFFSFVGFWIWLRLFWRFFLSVWLLLLSFVWGRLPWSFCFRGYWTWVGPAWLCLTWI